MNALALLAELDAAGVRLVREGDALRVTAKPGAIAPFVERIRLHKPALLAVLEREPQATPAPSSPVPPILSAADDERNEHRSRVLTQGEAAAIGLDGTLTWMRVSRDEVAATRPPAGWDGTLPDGCHWPSLCQTLGPCPHHLAGKPCHPTGEAS